MEPELLTIGGICLSDKSKEVEVDGEKVAMTRTEFDILLSVAGRRADQEGIFRTWRPMGDLCSR